MTSDKRNASHPAGAAPNIPSALEQRFGPIEQRGLAGITPYAGNPRKHPEKQVVQLMASMREFGFVLPLLVDINGALICGHARYEAARRLCMTEVPVLVASFWSAAQVKAYRLADNQLATAASWDEALLRIELNDLIEVNEVSIELLGWNIAEIDALLEADGSSAVDPADDIPETPGVPVSRAGDLWCLGNHRLLCGSSLDPVEWDRLMNGQIAAMTLTDAPYNVPVNSHLTGRQAEFAMASGEMSAAEFTDFNAAYLANMMTHLKDGAIIMAFMDHAHLAELMAAARKLNLKHLNLCVWVKSNGGMGSLWRSQHELVLVLKKGSAPHTNTVELGRRGRYRTNVWMARAANSFGANRNDDLADHPTVKPVALLADAIRDVTRHGEIVLDAFSGSGSTILACEKAKRIGYAIEIEPRFIDVAIRRWEKLTGKAAVLEGTGITFTQVAVERSSPFESKALAIAAE